MFPNHIFVYFLPTLFGVQRSQLASLADLMRSERLMVDAQREAEIVDLERLWRLP